MRLSNAVPRVNVAIVRSTLAVTITFLSTPVGLTSAQGALPPTVPIQAQVYTPNGFTCSANAPAPFGSAGGSAGCTVGGPLPGSAQASANNGFLSTTTTLTGRSTAPSQAQTQTMNAFSSAFWQSAISACYSATAGHTSCADTDIPFAGQIIFEWAIGGYVYLESTGTPNMDNFDRGNASYEYRLETYFKTMDEHWMPGPESVSTFNYSVFGLNGIYGGGPPHVPGSKTSIFTAGPTTTFGIMLNNWSSLTLRDDQTGGYATNTVNAKIGSLRFMANNVDVTDQIAYSFADDAVTATPEPASMALMATGLAALAGWKRRRSQKREAHA